MTETSPTESQTIPERIGAVRSLEGLRLPSSKAEVYPDSGVERKESQYKTTFATSPTFVTMVHFLKALLGPTILAIPGGFKHGGLAFSPPAYILLAALITYNSRRLVLSAAYLSEREGCAVRTYDQLAFVAFNTCSSWTKNYANFLKNWINVLIFVTYLDACIIFIIFAGRNIEVLLETYSPGLCMNVRHFIFLEMTVFMFMSSFRELKHLFVFSAVSSVMMILMIFAILVIVFLRDSDGTEGDVWMIGTPASIMKFACVVCFCFSGISVALTLKSSMKHPENFFSGPSIFYYSITITSACLLAFGFFGYWKYGAHTNPSVLLNVPLANPLYLTLKIITVLAVTLTTPLAFYVAFNVAWQNFFKHCFPATNIIFAEYFTRYCLISVCFLVAVSFPDLGWMIVMKGGLFHTNLEITLPAVLDYVVHYPEKGAGKFYLRLWKMLVISFFGVAFCIGGMTVTLFNL